MRKPKEGTHAKMNTISFPEQDGPFGNEGMNKDIREAVRFSFSNQTLHNIVKPKQHQLKIPSVQISHKKSSSKHTESQSHPEKLTENGKMVQLSHRRPSKEVLGDP